jgi:hypothetical protein
MGRVNHRVAQAATANKTQVDQVQMTAVTRKGETAWTIA